jgi:hypothetical protein
LPKQTLFFFQRKRELHNRAQPLLKNCRRDCFSRLALASLRTSSIAKTASSRKKCAQHCGFTRGNTGLRRGSQRECGDWANRAELDEDRIGDKLWYRVNLPQVLEPAGGCGRDSAPPQKRPRHREQAGWRGVKFIQEDSCMFDLDFCRKNFRQVFLRIGYETTGSARVPLSGQPASLAASKRFLVASMVSFATASCTISITSATL